MKAFPSKLASVVFTTFITLSITNPLVVQSEKIVEYTNCNTTKQKMIVDAWYSAMEIANNRMLQHFNWHIDGIGELGRLMSVAMTGSQGAPIRSGKFWPTPTIPVARSSHEHPLLGMTQLTFALSSSTSYQPVLLPWLGGGTPFLERREDLTNYQCQGYALLYGLFHLNSLSKVGSQGHIYDRNIRYRIHDGTLVSRQAYGPTYCKILASWANDNFGSYIVTNGLYHLSWVRKKIGLYPRFPNRDGLTQDPNLPPNLAAAFSTVNDKLIVNKTALLPYIQGPIVQTFDYLDGTCDEDFTDCSYATISSLTIDMMDPFANSTATGDTASEFNSPDSYQAMNIDAYILPSDPNLDCFKGKGIDWTQQPSVPQPFSTTQIANFCNLTQGIPMSNATQDVIDTMYPVPATTFNLWLQAGWQIGDPVSWISRASLL
ncbi:hypothetical protein NA56DRAFT_699124 [Hyaloscypha hepaticicola]|uniref:Uncharacterized protein n=1 Tax=Hyaloscypha hepaticicola TaxID=2082293 RepID=A0A2J6QIF4_9HELO|nr:hypothetical protein NA56DRAFT_699124 [Hyaloscypha hepaticicola]